MQNILTSLELLEVDSVDLPATKIWVNCREGIPKKIVGNLFVEKFLSYSTDKYFVGGLFDVFMILPVACACSWQYWHAEKYG